MSFIRHVGYAVRAAGVAILALAFRPAWAADEPWAKLGWRFRVPVEVHAGQYPRINESVELSMDFSEEMRALGRSGEFDERSIRVVEVDPRGGVLDPNAAFQFDRSPRYDPATRAAGTLVLFLRGSTPAGRSRRFHVYFDLAGKSYSLELRAEVDVADGIEYEGQQSVRIKTPVATYYYHKKGAAFASIFDRDGNDWISYSRLGPQAAPLRGIPNIPECCRAGGTGSNSQVLHKGPLRVAIHSESEDRQWALRWDIFPYSATMTLLRRGGKYWFLYEGTPGGRLELDEDYVVVSTGISRPARESWTGDLASPEWVYFGDRKLDRVLFLAHHEDDTANDQYWPRRGGTAVFGFGRQFRCCEAYMEDVPARFTIGLTETSSHDLVALRINSASQPVYILKGAPESRAEDRSDAGGVLDILRGLGRRLAGSSGLK